MSGVGHALLVPALSEHYRLSGSVEEPDTTPRIPAGAAGAWSCARKLVTSWSTNPLITVRRTAGGSNLAVGTVNNVLDTAALLAFCGSGDGFVVRVNDQTGNGRHLEQSDLSLQPKIVSGGSLITRGSGVPTMDFATSRCLKRADACGLTGAPALTVGHVTEVTSAAGYPHYCSIGAPIATATDQQTFLLIGNALDNAWSYISIINHGPNFNVATTLALRSYVGRIAAGAACSTARLRQNSQNKVVQSVAGNGALTLAMTNSQTLWGGGVGAAAGVMRDMPGYSSCLVIYNADLSGTDLTDLETVLSLHL